MRRFSLYLGGALVALVLLAAAVSAVWTPYDPQVVVPGEQLLAPGWPHLLGTDQYGVDIASRLLVGARSTVYVGIIAVSVALLVGVPLGVLAGMTGGWASQLVLRLTDILYAFPALLLAILLAATVGASTLTAMVAIGISSVPAFARVARAATVLVMTQDYILAARTSGTSYPRIALRHVLPNIAAIVGVQASVSFGIAILAEAALSYLGLSGPQHVVTWGRMLKDAQNLVFTQPEQALWPGLAIGLAVLGLNLLGDGLRDYLDPRLREAR
ncbi:MAG: ABC transporter permease [Actinomycetia bacterium]|nr:ABC transporter permease [Actinomycetes bacterium]